MRTTTLIFTLVLLGTVIAYAQQPLALLSKSDEIANIKKQPVRLNQPVAPSFQDETYSLAEFIKENLSYPTLAAEYSREGVVVVEFTVDKNGAISRPKIIQGIGLGCDKAVLTLIKKMPNWSPARQGDLLVASKVRIPLAFKLR